MIAARGAAAATGRARLASDCAATAATTVTSARTTRLRVGTGRGTTLAATATSTTTASGAAATAAIVGACRRGCARNGLAGLGDGEPRKVAAVEDIVVVLTLACLDVLGAACGRADRSDVTACV